MSRRGISEVSSVSRRDGLRAAVAFATTVSVAVVIGAAGGAATAGSHARPAAAPGRTGTAITVADHVSFDGDNRAYDMATDSAGTTYLGWLATSDVTSTGREIHLCTLPLRATGCRGGVQTIDSPDDSMARNIRVLSTANGAVTILWFIDNGGNGEIEETTSQSGGALTPVQTVASGPSYGVLLDAEFGPGGQIWTVAGPEYTGPLQVRAGLGAAPASVPTPYGVGHASLAFAGSTPIIAITKEAYITTPVAYSYRKSDSWTGFANVAGTWSAGTNVGLSATSSGVRLTASEADAGYEPVVARWNGHGFTKPKLSGNKGCAPNAHDTSGDASGRLVDVTDECGKIAVTNLADTAHGSTIRFPAGGTPAGGAPQIASLPRGYAWVAWSTQSNTSDSSQGDRLRVTPFLLPGLHRRVTRRSSHGSVSVTGPASCLPADTLSVSVTGHGAHHWKLEARTLELGHAKVGKTINGASLAAGKAYVLTGTARFAHGHLHRTVRVKLTFRSCPLP